LQQNSRLDFGCDLNLLVIYSTTSQPCFIDVHQMAPHMLFT